MAALYADENFPHPCVDHLRSLGYDVLTVRVDGRADLGIDDDDVLNRAIELGRAVLTHNRRHFQRLHHLVPDHSGIVSCTDDLNFVALAERIHLALSLQTILDGLLVRVYRT